MKWFPIVLKLENKNCLVVGGGKVAQRKVKSLLEAGGKVTLVSPKVTQTLEELINQQKVIYHKRCYQRTDLKNRFLVIAATNDQAVNQQIAHQAHQKAILVNVVDNALLSSFIMPASFQRGDLIISVSTRGKSPALAQRIRNELKRVYSNEYGVLLNRLGKLRQNKNRRQIYQKIISQLSK